MINYDISKADRVDMIKDVGTASAGAVVTVLGIGLAFNSVVSLIKKHKSIFESVKK